jgi:ribose/xylose/arabinose/galactoside ABC-type transport system permease subunit
MEHMLFVICSVVALVLLIVATSTEKWAGIKKDKQVEDVSVSGSANIGIWETCSELSINLGDNNKSENQCKSYTDKTAGIDNKTKTYAQVCQAFSILSILALVGAIACTFLCKSHEHVIVASLAFMSMIFALITTIVFSTGLKKQVPSDFDYQYSFYLQIAGLVLTAVAAALAMFQHKKMMGHM